MNTDYKHIGILLILVIIASGCGDSPEEDSSGTFMQVNSFEAQPNPVPAGESLTMNMEIENTGDAEAKDVVAQLFGPAFISELSWAEKTQELGEMQASSDTSFPKRQSWDISTPELSQNREVDYNIYSKIFYGYTTRADTSFKVVSRERFRDQGYARGEASIDNSDAPIEIGIRGNTPITYDSEDGDIEEQVCLTVENTGAGTAFTGGKTGGSRIYSLDDGSKNSVKLAIEEVPGMNFETPDDVTNNAQSGEEARVTVDLIEGREGWQCFTMTPEGSITNSETNVNTLISAEYNYVEETSTSVTVEGRR